MNTDEARSSHATQTTQAGTERTEKITDQSLGDLQPQCEEHADLKELRGIIAGLQHKLGENTAAKERMKEKQTAIQARKKECHRWENLHELIGSADGKKYRNFAQGMTFEMMIGQANRQSVISHVPAYLPLRNGSAPRSWYPPKLEAGA